MKSKELENGDLFGEVPAPPELTKLTVFDQDRVILQNKLSADEISFKSIYWTRMFCYCKKCQLQVFMNLYCRL